MNQGYSERPNQHIDLTDPQTRNNSDPQTPDSSISEEIGEKEKYSNWISTVSLVYNYIHFYDIEKAPNTKNRSFINWLSPKVRDSLNEQPGNHENTWWCSLTTSFKSEIDNKIESYLNVLALDFSPYAYEPSNIELITKLRRTGICNSLNNNKYLKRRSLKMGEEEIIATCTKQFVLGTAHSNNMIKINKLKQMDGENDTLLKTCYHNSVKLTGGITFTDDNICVGAQFMNKAAFVIFSTSPSNERNDVLQEVGVVGIDSEGELKIKDITCNERNQIYYGVSNKSHLYRFDPRDSTINNCSNMAKGSINSIDINPFDSNILAIGGQDGIVSIWDIRTLSSSAKNKPVWSISAHNDEITKVKWSPFNNNIIASSSYDRFVNVFDTLEKAYIIRHAGHRYPVSDFNWCNQQQYPNTIASVDQGSDDCTATLQIWAFSDFVLPNRFQHGKSGFPAKH